MKVFSSIFKKAVQRSYAVNVNVSSTVLHRIFYSRTHMIFDLRFRPTMMPRS